MGHATETLISSALDDPLRQRLHDEPYPSEADPCLLDYESFQDRLTAALRDLPASRELALIWIDLTKLRRAFSLRGWRGAELLERQMAGVLRSKAGEATIVGRLSAPCLLVAMPTEKHNRRQRISSLVGTLPNVCMQEVGIEPQIAAGVAFYPSDAGCAEDLVRFASLAADRAERSGGAIITNFHAAMNSILMRDYRLEVEIQNGLERDQFSMAYQPKVNLINGSILGVEGLIRWTHPEWGNVPPGEFIPVAERSGLICRIFAFALRTALSDAKQWRECGYPIPLVTVNASAANLRRSNFVPTVRRMLGEHSIMPTRLELEITESVLFDDERLFVARVRQLHEIGVRIALDDFGTRYTGFNVLKRIPLDAMKIDKCFVQGIDRSSDMKTICQTVVTMARHLRLRAVAEGIETYEELEVLRRIGCEAGQGYLFQRPMTRNALEKFLHEWPERSRCLGFRRYGGAIEMQKLHSMGTRNR
jgi:EAL domain-containing protein (putative c-di-GMP-specific phosphodiesterase class I)